MTKVAPSFIICSVVVLALLITAPAILIYFIGTHEASVDPIISKIGIVACAHPENFTECHEGIIRLVRETLEVREERINRWLYGISGFLGLVTWFFTALAILVAFGGVFGIWQFHSLRDEAKEKVKELDKWVEKSEIIYKDIHAWHIGIKRMKDDIEDKGEEITPKLEGFDSDLQDFNQDKNEVFESLEKLQEKIGSINKASEKIKDVMQLLNMAEESANGIIASEKRSQEYESEIKGIRDNLKDSDKDN